MRRVWIAFVVTSLGGSFVGSVAACSSVPEITFVEDDAATRVDASSSSSGTTSSGGPDAAVDTGTPGLCATGGPLPADGICCGKIPCYGCELGDCATCEGACALDPTPACQKFGKNNVRCQR